MGTLSFRSAAAACRTSIGRAGGGSHVSSFRLLAAGLSVERVAWFEHPGVITERRTTANQSRLRTTSMDQSTFWFWRRRNVRDRLLREPSQHLLAWASVGE